MKLIFVKSIQRLRIKSLPVLFSLLLSPLAAMATDSTATFSGSINNANLPNVDATNFYNSGSWNIVTTPLPYETQHTLNYTNTGNGTTSGSMIGSVGWEFDYGPLTDGGRGMSASFFNDGQAVIQANDGTVSYLSGYYDNLASYLLISATNIVNKGTLIAGANGEIVLTGANVTLARSSLEIAGIQAQGNIISSNNFTPDTAIYDEYWLEGTNLNVFGSPWSGTGVYQFTFFNASEPCEASNATVQIGPLTPQVADSYTTNLNPYTVVTTNSSGNPNPPFTLYSNIVRQASFVAVSDPNITASNHFNSALVPTNYFETVAVQFIMLSTNVVTLAVQTNTLYLVDDLASSTNRTLLTNSVINPAAECTSPTLRPGSVIVSRTDPILAFGSVFNTGAAFASGAPGMGPPPANFFYDTTFSNYSVANGIFDLYSASVDNLASEIPGSSEGASITNLPGRIQIYANNLDLTRTRMDDEGAEITIVATTLIGSAGAAISCQNLSFNLGSTNGFLNITNLVIPTVTRLHGTVDEWSGLWTNVMYVITNNYMPVVNGGLTNWVPSPLTNTEEMDLAITVVDATGLSSTVPVTVQNLVLNSTNITISDNINDIAQSFFFGGQSLTILGNLNLSGVQDWAYTNAPTIQYFTNNGVLTIPNNAHFGDDGPTNYLTFVNNGVIFSGAQIINSVNLQINGTNETSSGPFYGICQTGQLSGAGIFSAGDIQFSANSLQFSQGNIISAQNALDFTVTNSLSDSGDGSGNTFYCQNGFNLYIKPATGDLLGTTITTMASGQDEVDHLWAGLDQGATAAGFTNNVVIGDLVLSPIGNTNLEPLFAFYGTTGGNGLYVNNLDLSQLTDYANEIYIDPSLTIYFVTANLNANVDITGFPDAEHYLNGKFGGHLVWAQGIGSLIQKKALNNYLQLTANSGVVGGVKLTQTIMPSQTNVIQASTDLTHWVPIYTNIGSYTNIGASTVPDPDAKNHPFRFYRIMSLP
ncbi:MAG TPA: hypothetical protein VGM58_04780 [Verrucomicrobiae bacterium]